MLVVSQSVGGGSPAVLQLRLQLQEATPVIGLPGGTLLQQSLLIGLSIFCHLPLDGVGLAKSLEQRRSLGRSNRINSVKSTQG